MATFAVAGWKTIQSISQYRSEKNVDVKNQVMEKGLVFAVKTARAALVYFTLYAANVWVGHFGIKAALVATSWCISSPATLEVAALVTFKWACTYWKSADEVYKQLEQTLSTALKAAEAQGLKDCYYIELGRSYFAELSDPFENFLNKTGVDLTIKSLSYQFKLEDLKGQVCLVASVFSAAICSICFFDPTEENFIPFKDPLGLDAKIAACAKNYAHRQSTQ
jgi:hypothetical protein